MSRGFAVRTPLSSLQNLSCLFIPARGGQVTLLAAKCASGQKRSARGQAQRSRWILSIASQLRGAQSSPMYSIRDRSSNAKIRDVGAHLIGRKDANDNTYYVVRKLCAGRTKSRCHTW